MTDTIPTSTGHIKIYGSSYSPKEGLIATAISNNWASRVDMNVKHADREGFITALASAMGLDIKIKQEELEAGERLKITYMPKGYSNDVKVGDIVTVKKVNRHHGFEGYLYFEGACGLFDPLRIGFEKLPAPVFKVGDRVRILRNPRLYSTVGVGSIGVVQSVGATTVQVRGDIAGAMTLNHAPEDLELFEYLIPAGEVKTSDLNVGDKLIRVKDTNSSRPDKVGTIVTVTGAVDDMGFTKVDGMEEHSDLLFLGRNGEFRGASGAQWALMERAKHKPEVTVKTKLDCSTIDVGDKLMATETSSQFEKGDILVVTKKDAYNVLVLTNERTGERHIQASNGGGNDARLKLHRRAPVTPAIPGLDCSTVKEGDRIRATSSGSYFREGDTLLVTSAAGGTLTTTNERTGRSKIFVSTHGGNGAKMELVEIDTSINVGDRFRIAEIKGLGMDYGARIGDILVVTSGRGVRVQRGGFGGYSITPEWIKQGKLVRVDHDTAELKKELQDTLAEANRLAQQL